MYNIKNNNLTTQLNLCRKLNNFFYIINCKKKIILWVKRVYNIFFLLMCIVLKASSNITE